LLTLAVGSILVTLGLIGFANGPNYNEDTFAIMLFTWPFTLAVAGVLGTAALARTQGFSAALALLVGGPVAAYIFVSFALGLVSRLNGGDLRGPGISILLVPLVFLTVNVAAVYVAWSRILHRL